MSGMDISRIPYSEGLHQVSSSCWAWLQPGGGFCLSNAGLIARGGQTLLVDTLIDTPRTQRMLDTMTQALPQARRIDQAVNTHGDIDHISGNYLLHGTHSIMARGCALHYANIGATVSVGSTASGEFALLMKELGFDKFDRSGVVHRPPDQIFEGKLTLDIGGHPVELVEFGPAHTKSDTVIHDPHEGVVFTGDLMFCNCHPVLGYWPVQTWIDIYDTILSWQAPVIVPGHGPVCGPQEVVRHKDYLQFLQDAVTTCFKAGLSETDATMRVFDGLGRYSYLLRADILRKNVSILYAELKGDGTVHDFRTHSVHRWRFRELIRGRAPGIHLQHVPDGN